MSKLGLVLLLVLGPVLRLNCSATLNWELPGSPNMKHKEEGAITLRGVEKDGEFVRKVIGWQSSSEGRRQTAPEFQAPMAVPPRCPGSCFSKLTDTQEQQLGLHNSL